VVYKHVYWNDVREGEELPAYTRPITTTTVVSCAIASRDFLGLHHDREVAQQAGLKDIFVNTPTFYGLAGKYLTDWTGPEGELKEVSLRLMLPCFPGDTMTIKGKVARKYAEGDEHLLDLEFTLEVEAGTNCKGRATIALPVNAGG